MVLLITYDLNKVKDYKRLYQAIGALGETKRDASLDSVWFVSTNHTPDQASDYLRKATDSDDHHIVTRLRNGDHQGWMSKEVWEWINVRL